MDEVAVLRRFNRRYTQAIGVLAESYLDTGRPLGPSRLLFEIGLAGVRLADVRRRLGLDSGYLSRLLRRLEDEGLVEVATDPGDGRQRLVRLSPSGRREWRRLDERAEAAGRRLLESLSTRQRSDLASALTTAERLLRAATVETRRVDPRSPAARAAQAQYYAELDERFPSGFAPADSEVDATALRPPHGAFLVLCSDGEPIGCGGVQRIDDVTAEIKRMWVHADWRARGLGGRLLAQLEVVARELGRSRVVLDTNETLVEAIAMYERAGYQPIKRYNDNPYAQRWFAKDLAGRLSDGRDGQDGTPPQR